MTRANLTSVRAVMIHQDLLDERSRYELDRWDEVWDGVLHMVPPPAYEHQRVTSRLLVFLSHVLDGFDVLVQAGVFESEKNYRVPDLVVAHPSQAANRGVDGAAELVIEVLSPRDESRNKLEFYAARGVREVWIVDPTTRAIEVHALRGDRYVASVPDADRRVRAPHFGIELQVLAGPRLRLRRGDSSEEI